jgi:steroid delta-isomerase-like uncharacterized protein
MIDVTMQTGVEGGGVRLPLLPTRDIVISPHMVVPLYIGRRKSVRAIEEAVGTQKLVFLVLQRDSKINDVIDKDLYEVGTVADIVQRLNLPDGTMKVLVAGKQRGRILRYVDDPDCFLAEIEEIQEHYERTTELEQVMASVKTAFQESRLKLASTPPEMALVIKAIEEPSLLADTVVAHLNITIDEKQRLLETIDPAGRLRKILEYASLPIEIHHEIRQEEESLVLHAQEPLPSQETKYVVESYLFRLENRDVDFLLKALTEDFVFDESPMTMAEPIHGKQRFQEYLTLLFAAFPDLNLYMTNILVAESKAWVEWVMKGTHQGVFLDLPPTGRQIEIPGVSVFTVCEGKVAQVRMYWDSGHLRRQLGALA